MNIVKECKYGSMIFNDKDIWQGRSLNTYGEYSEEEVKLYRKILKDNDTVLEIGANIGSLTVPLAQIVKNGIVISFEPERNAFYNLCGNIAINNLSNVLAFQQAIGKESGVIKVPELDLDKTDNFGGLELELDYSKSKNYLVGMVSIDDLNLQKCNLIKIDVEGMELSVLKGATGIINKFNPFLIVEDDRPYKSAALRAFIDSLGYNIYFHKASFFNSKNFLKKKKNVFNNIASLNLFCYKQNIDFDPIADFGMEKVN